MSEFRKDPASKRWVILTDEKGFSPEKKQGVPCPLPQNDKSCAFCPGNEGRCGHEIHRVGEKTGWKVRVVPNNLPYLKVEPELKESGGEMFRTVSGTGANEVIIESPAHNVDFDSMVEKDVSAVIKTYRDRTNDLRKDSRMEYILIYKNRGEMAGAVNYHLHSQLVAMPLIPRLIAEEMDSCRDFHGVNGSCLYCEMIKEEGKRGLRVVMQNDDFMVITPFASQVSFALWIIPKMHMAHFYTLSETLSDSLSGIMKECIRKLNRALNRPAYNYMIHTAPVKFPDSDYYHWHIEIMPIIRQAAGFEWGSGFHINPTPPEEAAAYLRKI